ncbi:CS1 type fimbrial major subunit [Yersinia hibernica]|uniref:Alpha-related fimbriae minor subunit 1 n=1 Tax=Yersinia enterocolitica LC20 TaxID=1443113 RepID=A0A7U4GIN6_YEREN|nr:CS1 type fimbrial major subunit [Yersinia hibernica]AHM76247.2 hypothetical protein LC20_04996 [Yersinia hibernica]
MMKKTLLSIVTMAALVSSTAVYAQPLEKNIQVEAEIHSVVSMNKADGTPLDKIKLNYDVQNNDGTYTHTENIKIKSATANKIKVSTAENFLLSDKNGNGGFTNHKVMLGGKEILYIGALNATGMGTANFGLDANHEADLDLVISAKQIENPPAGIYSGIVKLVIEEEN